MKRFRLFFSIFLVTLIGMTLIGCSGGILLRVDVAGTIKQKLGLHGPNEVRLVMGGMDIYPLNVIVIKEYDRAFEVIAPDFPGHVPYKVEYSYAGNKYDFAIKAVRWSGGQWRVGHGKLYYPGNQYEGPLIVAVYYYRDDTVLGKYGELQVNRTYLAQPLATAQYTIYFPYHTKR